MAKLDSSRQGLPLGQFEISSDWQIVGGKVIASVTIDKQSYELDNSIISV